METIRFGVVGCGGIGPTHCGAIRQIPGAELVAVADLVPERAASVAQKYAVPRVYESDVALLADSEIDAVCLCTPSGQHAEGAIAALRAGKHVVVEKPMEVSLEACDRLIQVADETGLVVTVISQHRFDPATRLVKETVDSGQLGRIVLVEARVPWWRTQGYYDSGDWRGTWALDGGGALMNQGVHTVDVLQWLMSSQGRVIEIYGQTRTAAHERIEVEDVAVATLAFSSGAVGTLMATTAAWDGFPVRITLYGTEGTAILEGDRLKSLKLRSGVEFASEEAALHALSVARGGTASVKSSFDDDLTSVREEAGTLSSALVRERTITAFLWGDSHRAQIADFMQAIRSRATHSLAGVPAHEDGTKPLIDARAGRVPVEIILSLYRSARIGSPVVL